jgi:cytosine/adenosine deaminase-related metal-dependent hydrolase
VTVMDVGQLSSAGTLVRGKFVLTQNARYGTDGVLTDGAVYVSGSDIVEVGRYRDLKAVYPNASVLGSPRYWVAPGFVSAHQHGIGLTSFQLGGLDECLELSRLTATPQPRVDPYLSTVYACMGMIESGTTTCLHYNVSRPPFEADIRERLRGYAAAGIRVSFGLEVRDRNHLVYGDDVFLQGLPAPLREQAAARAAQPRSLAPDAYFHLVRELSSGLEEGGRIRIALTPNGPQWSTEDLLHAIKREAEERELAVQMQCLETRYQRSYFARTYGKTAIQWLDDQAFLSPRVSLAYGVWLSRDDMAILAQRRTAVVHKPSSGLRLRSGIAPLPLLYETGVPLALGLDASGFSDDRDMFEEMRLCANLQRVPNMTRPLVPLQEIFRMATVNGAQALGWGALSGTLEPGKRADLVLLDMRAASSPYLSPVHHPVDTLIYRGRASWVDTVMVDGEMLYQGKRHVRLAAKSIVNELVGGMVPPSEPPDPLNRELLPYVVKYYGAWDEDPVAPYHAVNSVQ